VHVTPLLLGSGSPLFGALNPPVTLRRSRVEVTSAATQLWFRVTCWTCRYGTPISQ
jgi:hypothetical protein